MRKGINEKKKSNIMIFDDNYVNVCVYIQDI